LIWVVVEFTVRRLGSAAVLGGWKRYARVSAPEPVPMVVLVAAITLAMVILAWAFRCRVRREGLTAADLGYRWSRGAVLVGALSALVLLTTFVGTALVDRVLFRPQDDPPWVRRIAAAGPTAQLALLVSNGLLVPVVEEYAWRGYIQLRFMQGWGVLRGGAATAVFFAAKHVIVDLSLERTTTLLVGAAALGIIARRWGTGASTIAHAVTNLTATLLVLASVAGR
jgi:membrane protease YdiL (CAAX protease family)